MCLPDPVPMPGLRRRPGSNMNGSNSFIQQSGSSNFYSSQTQQHYYGRSDAQSRLNNAKQVESTIVEVRTYID